NYFDTFYELDRYELAGTAFSSKAQMLDNTTTAEAGYFGDLTIAILGKLQIRGTYSKLDNVDTSGTLHGRSLLHASIGYKPYPFMIVSMLYLWTFVPVLDSNGNTYFATQKRVEPKVSIVFPL